MKNQKLKRFETLKNKEINEVIFMSYDQLLKKMLKNSLAFITYGQIKLIRDEVLKNPIKGDLK